MTEFWCALCDSDPGECLVQRDLARRGRQQILAPQYVGDVHQGVVDRIDQRVQRITVAARQGEVGDRARPDHRAAAHEIVPLDVAVGHRQTHHRGSALVAVGLLLLIGQGAVEVVVTQLRVAAGRLVAGLDLVGRREGLIRFAGLEQLGHHVEMLCLAQRLTVRRVRATDLGALVPLEPEPAKGVEQGLIRLLAVSRRVGVLDPEHEGATGVPRVDEVEQRGAHQTDVGGAGR